MNLKTNLNNKENLVEENREISKDKSHISTSKDKVNEVADNSINTSNKVNGEDKNT